MTSWQTVIKFSPDNTNRSVETMINENGLPFKPTNDTLASDLKQALKEVKNGETTAVSVDEFMKILDDPDGYTND